MLSRSSALATQVGQLDTFDTDLLKKDRRIGVPPLRVGWPGMPEQLGLGARETERPMPEPKSRHDRKLLVPLPFEDAIRAALEVKPSSKPPRKKRESKKSRR